MRAGVNIVWMKAHHSDRRVQLFDLQENRMANTAAKATRQHVPFEPSQEWEHWGPVCQVARDFWLFVGPKFFIRPENWPRVRLPAPELVLVEVVPVMETNLPATPFEAGLH
eukprot:4791564-Amphidinium_carterae.1